MNVFSSSKDETNPDMMVFILKEPNVEKLTDENTDYYEGFDELYYPFTMPSQQSSQSPSEPTDSCYDMGSVYNYMESPMECQSQSFEKPLIQQIQDCSHTCYQMMFDLIDNDCNRQKQIHLLYECARTCESLSLFILTNSMFAKDHARLCAAICEACANVCASYPDPNSQHCAKTCFDCARACRAYA